MAKGYGFEVSDIVVVGVIGGAAYLLYKTISPVSEGAGKATNAAGDFLQTNADAYKFILEEEGKIYKNIMDSLGNLKIPNINIQIPNMNQQKPVEVAQSSDIVRIKTSSGNIREIGGMAALQAVENPQAPTAANTINAANTEYNKNSILNLKNVSTPKTSTEKPVSSSKIKLYGKAKIVNGVIVL